MSKSNKRSVQPAKDDLPRDEISSLLQAIAEFRTTYTLSEAKDVLQEGVYTAISKSPSIYDNGLERSNLLFFLERFNALMEVIYAMHEQPPAKTSRTSKRSSKK